MYTSQKPFEDTVRTFGSGTSVSLSGKQSFDVTVRNILPGVRTGTSVSGWKQVIRQGRNAASDYSVDIQRSQHKPAHMSLGYNVNSDSRSPFSASGSTSSFTSGYLAHQALNTASVDSKALSKLYDKIRAERSQMNGMQFLGELRETIHMLRRPAAALRDGFLRFTTDLNKKKGRLGRVSPKYRSTEWTKIYSGTLLEANFGWAPFISDIQAIAETAARIQLDDALIRRSRLVSRSELSNVIQGPLNGNVEYIGTALYYLTFRRDIRWSTTYTCQYIAGMGYTQETALSGLQRLAQISGFTAENLLPTVYELIPLSFLADYVSNLGDVISGSVTDTSNVVRASKTTKTVTEFTFFDRPVDPSPDLINVGASGIGWTGSVGIQQYLRTTLNRVASVGLGVPSFHLSYPGNSAKKIANVVALLNEFRHPSGHTVRPNLRL